MGAGLDLCGRRTDGSEFPVDVSLSLLETETRRFTICAIKDVTENKKAGEDGPMGMKFVPLPKATFYMGWENTKQGVKTEIKEDFEIAVHMVTQEQWQAVMGNNPSRFSRDGQAKVESNHIPDADLTLFPVESVSWNDAQEFIKKLNEKEAGRGYEYRLPRDAEWEYACRGGATSEEEC